MNKWLSGTVLSLAATFALTGTAMADRFPAGPHLYVTGEAVEKLKPDFVETSFMVARTGADVPATKKEVDAITDKVWAAAKKTGIAREDFQATGFSVNPMYDYEDGKRIYRGTQVSRQFNVKLRNMDKFNAWSEALVQTGVQDIAGISVNVDQREEKEAALRVTALKNAKLEAERLAGALDQVVTGVHTISDSPIGEGGGGIRAMAMRMDKASEGAPTLPDHVELRAEAYVVFTMMKK
ncbi:SIMPL domain-containing protein [Permianibacter sp. IMCC34836]|uniref:SIMPL domain-containing protein n=1 Tax=Permianibacter fluminis TaxID=2738515 RepID=UPI0015535DA6|nr:SIMPL domain-containing protein [Permianibacter fluminis]NQD35730.1 SIMPL domain-containing protein [Permianibacter fluminis]